MSSVNKVILIGNLGRDPEVKYLPSGMAICNIPLATSYRKKGDDGEYVEETEWHRVVLIDRLAELAGEYLSTGKKFYIEGRLRTRKWTDKEGVEKYTTEVIASGMQFLSPRDEGDEPKSHGEQRQQKREEQTKPAAKKPQTKSGTGFDYMDDDIPF